MIFVDVDDDSRKEGKRAGRRVGRVLECCMVTVLTSIFGSAASNAVYISFLSEAL